MLLPVIIGVAPRRGARAAVAVVGAVPVESRSIRPGETPLGRLPGGTSLIERVTGVGAVVDEPASPPEGVDPSPSDESTPLSARDGFASLFHEYDRDVHRVCRRMLGDPESAADAVSEVFLRARRAFGGFDSSREFRPWLIAIAGNYCIDQLRRRTNEARIFSTAEAPESEMKSPDLSPLGRLMAAEDRKLLGSAIESLPVRYRLPLILRYFDGMDYASIADSIGVTRNQVGTLLFRAKRLLREAVIEAGHRDPVETESNRARPTGAKVAKRSGRKSGAAKRRSKSRGGK